ncbi:MAG: Crp/Fnr family transcriptional regulator [Bacteroidetes bacterium]|nr:Crp/Fnr family transcriptional regulator [Bacteroidota bacterium]MBL6944455.1 Crp/Fnr family transcriptional regulator [Bacteroidales bacterium]
MNKKHISEENLNFDMSSNVLKFLSEEQKEYIRNIMFSVNFSKGEIIFKQGTPMLHIVFIIGGMAKIYIEDNNNKNIVISLIKPGEIIGGPGFYTDYKHHFSVTALENTTACFIEVAAFKKMILESPEFGLEFIRYRNIRHINFYDKLRVTSHKQMNGRLAHTLLYLSDTVYHSNSFKTTLTRQDLADMSSMTKESAIRVLKSFKESGIIECQNNDFEIKNKTALKNILESG